MKRLLVIIALLISSVGIAQTKSYSIQSFEGVSQKIELSETDAGRTIVIKYLDNKLSIRDCYGILKVHILNKKFLELIYSDRGGSGFDPTGVLILCVSNGKMIASMNFMYAFRTVDVGYEENYRSTITIKGNDTNDYKLFVYVHDKLDGKRRTGEGPYDKHQTTVFAFDPVNKIFYSGHKTLNQTFKFFDKRKPQHIKGVFPIVSIAKDEYYFIDGLWNNIGHFPPGEYLSGDYLNSAVVRN